MTSHGSKAAFDQVATRYDAESTDVPLSRFLRQRVWSRLEKLFSPGDRVLELGCGTGEDALWLARRGVSVTASDVSPAMLEVTEAKIRRAGLEPLVEYRLLDLAEARTWDLPDAAYDGVTSNYGPLNCIGDWRDLGSALARTLKPGGCVGLAVMGPICVWEVAWHALHGDLRTATRRWRGRAIARIDGVSFPVFYPTPRRLLRDLGPHFRRPRLDGLGVCIPPSDVYGAVGKHPGLAKLLMRLEQLCAPRWPFKYLGDHYWLEVAAIHPNLSGPEEA
jgi:ubiquinone/menaquinone biosynthesis C-methylase UbiE